MKPLVIYHANCTDGYGAAFAAWLKLGDEAEYLPMQYGQLPNDESFEAMIKNREVYILDFSLPRPMMAFMFAFAKRVVWLDHHKTAFEMWCGGIPNNGLYMEDGLEKEEGNPFDGYIIILDNNKSGALLAWEYFHPGTEVPLLIQHIDDRDRWQWKMEGSAEIHAALGSMKPWSFEQWRVWCNSVVDGNAIVGGLYEPRGYLFDQGTAILRAQKQHVEQMAKQARKCVIALPDSIRSYATGLAVNASLHQSEVGHELANASGTFGLVWYVASDLRVRCSLRSNGDYDVSGIARSFGGGGHKNASGMEVDVETLMGWLT